MGPEKMERRTRTRPRNVDQRSGMAPRRVVDRRTSQFLSRLFSQVSRKRVCFLFFSPYILSFSLEIDLVVSSSFTNEIVSGTRKNGIFTIGLCVDTRPDWITRTTATFLCRSRLCLSLSVCMCGDPLLFARPCTSLSRTQFFCCPSSATTATLEPSRQSWWLLYVPFFLSVSRSIGSRWSMERKCVLMPDTVACHDVGSYIRTLSACLSADATKVISLLALSSIYSIYLLVFFLCWFLPLNVSVSSSPVNPPSARTFFSLYFWRKKGRKWKRNEKSNGNFFSCSVYFDYGSACLRCRIWKRTNGAFPAHAIEPFVVMKVFCTIHHCLAMISEVKKKRKYKCVRAVEKSWKWDWQLVVLNFASWSELFSLRPRE